VVGKAQEGLIRSNYKLSEVSRMRYGNPVCARGCLQEFEKEEGVAFSSSPSLDVRDTAESIS